MKTTNLSKIRRDKMLNTINEIKKNITDEEILTNLSMIENELTKKKYGLIWEEHEERVDKELETQIPTFEEVKDREIVSCPNDKFNFLLEGDNLHSLYLLEKTHKEKIDVIYIDPPYNTKSSDFIYDDKIINAEDTFRHSKWLSFMNRRLKIAKNLLAHNGVIFISIDENEFSQLKLLCDEIFGEQNFIDCIIWNKRVPKNDKGIGNIHEYILLYAKKNNYKYKFLMPKDGMNDIEKLINDLRRKKISIQESEIELKKLYKKNNYDRAITLYNNLDDDYNVWGKINLSWPNGNTFGPKYDILHPMTKKPVKVPDRGWRWSEETFKSMLDYNNVKIRYDGSIICGKIWFAKDEKTQPSSIKYLNDVERMLLRSIVSTKSDGGMELEKLFGEKSKFAYPKPVALIKLLIDSITYNNKNGLILDFFAGSGTTAQAVQELNCEDNGNRHFILCTNNENKICEDITYKRLLKINNGISKVLTRPYNLKYYKCTYIPRINTENENLHSNLLINIKNLIQLENGIEIDDNKIRVYLDEDELDKFSKNQIELDICEKVYISSDILLTSMQETIFKNNNIEVYIIPEYYFEDEIMEVI